MNSKMLHRIAFNLMWIAYGQWLILLVDGDMGTVAASLFGALLFSGLSFYCYQKEQNQDG